MTFAQGSRSGLSYVVEPSFGSTPTAPTMIDLPYKRHSLDLTKQRLQGEDIRPDRMPRVSRHGNRNAIGDIEVDLRADAYDDFLESAFFNTFTTAGVLTIGTSPQFMTIEDRALDIAQYRQYTGCAVSTMRLSTGPNRMVETTFSMVGKDMTQSGTSLDSSPNAASTEDPFDSYSGAIEEGGSSIAIVTGIDMTLTNSLAPTFVVGSAVTPQLEFGRAIIEGNVTVYYQDASLINKFLNETETSLQFAFDDVATGSTYTFLLPRIKVNGASVGVANPQSRTITLPFEALYDTSTGTNMRLTKS